MKKLLSGILLLAVILSCALSFAKVKQGNQEVAVSGSVTQIDGYTYSGRHINAGTQFNLGGSYGTFLTDALEFGVSTNGDLSMNSNAGSSQLTGGGFLKYHFFTETDIVPYVGGQLGATRTATYQPNERTLRSTKLSYGGMIGVKWFVKENTSFFIEYNLNATKDMSNNSLITNRGLFGMAVYF